MAILFHKLFVKSWHIRSPEQNDGSKPMRYLPQSTRTVTSRFAAPNLTQIRKERPMKIDATDAVAALSGNSERRVHRDFRIQNGKLVDVSAGLGCKSGGSDGPDETHFDRAGSGALEHLCA